MLAQCGVIPLTFHSCRTAVFCESLAATARKEGNCTLQDKYAGDIGDFGKLVLLRQLSLISSRQPRLGVNWFRSTTSDRGLNDGSYISYLASDPKADNFRICDPSLYDILKRVVSISRSIQAIENEEILPVGTVFYSEPIPLSSDFKQRIVQRVRWFEESRSKLGPADVVFLDPDNGIQSQKVKKSHIRAIKYAFVDEIRAYFDSCDIVIVYNHRDRTPSDRYRQKFVRVQNELDSSAQLRVLHFKRFSARDYVFFHKKSARKVVQAVFDKLAAAPFNFLFEELRLS